MKIQVSQVRFAAARHQLASTSVGQCTPTYTRAKPISRMYRKHSHAQKYAVPHDLKYAFVGRGVFRYTGRLSPSRWWYYRMRKASTANSMQLVMAWPDG